MNKKLAEKYLNAINASKVRHLTCESLSHNVGIYPEIIAADLTFFEPMIAMDVNYDLRELIKPIEDYVASFEKVEVKKDPVPVFKLEAKKFKSVADFIYQKMTINGLVDRSVILSENDLKILKVLIQIELDKR